jgi:hypothetical protein
MTQRRATALELPHLGRGKQAAGAQPTMSMALHEVVCRVSERSRHDSGRQHQGPPPPRQRPTRRAASGRLPAAHVRWSLMSGRGQGFRLARGIITELPGRTGRGSCGNPDANTLFRTPIRPYSRDPRHSAGLRHTTIGTPGAAAVVLEQGVAAHPTCSAHGTPSAAGSFTLLEFGAVAIGAATKSLRPRAARSPWPRCVRAPDFVAVDWARPQP